ncbi:MAG TPA: ABC transporter permease subunit, partial [Opitutales bacterium]|nr:ABC transporter permease subunit [Opitutales bacterium]
GANNWNVGVRILSPLLGPGIIAGGLLAFTLSVDDFVVTFFTSGPGSTTLPVQVYSMMRHGTPTLINALSVIFILVTFSVVIFSQRIIQKRNSTHSRV